MGALTVSSSGKVYLDASSIMYSVVRVRGSGSVLREKSYRSAERRGGLHYDAGNGEA